MAREFRKGDIIRQKVDPVYLYEVTEVTNRQVQYKQTPKPTSIYECATSGCGPMESVMDKYERVKPTRRELKQQIDELLQLKQHDAKTFEKMSQQIEELEAKLREKECNPVAVVDIEELCRVTAKARTEELTNKVEELREIGIKQNRELYKLRGRNEELEAENTACWEQIKTGARAARNLATKVFDKNTLIKGLQQQLADTRQSVAIVKALESNIDITIHKVGNNFIVTRKAHTDWNTCQSNSLYLAFVESGLLSETEESNADTDH